MRISLQYVILIVIATKKQILKNKSIKI